MNRFEKMKDQLKKPIEIVSAPLLYPTPVWLADKMAQLLDFNSHHSILEPSAGTGCLLDALERNGPDEMDEAPTAVEINSGLVSALRKKYNSDYLTVIQDDFLTIPPGPEYDRIIMNPPFNGGLDIKHIEHALKFLKPSGCLVAICANGPRQEKILKPLAALWEVLPPGTFESSGTMVNTVLMVVQL